MASHVVAAWRLCVGKKNERLSQFETTFLAFFFFSRFMTLSFCGMVTKTSLSSEIRPAIWLAAALATDNTKKLERIPLLYTTYMLHQPREETHSKGFPNQSELTTWYLLPKMEEYCGTNNPNQALSWSLITVVVVVSVTCYKTAGLARLTTQFNPYSSKLAFQVRAFQLMIIMPNYFIVQTSLLFSIWWQSSMLLWPFERTTSCLGIVGFFFRIAMPAQLKAARRLQHQKRLRFRVESRIAIMQ